MTRKILPLLLLTGLASPALAQRLDQGSLPREVAGEVTTLYEAPNTLRADGRFEVEAGRTIDRDLLVLDGTLTLAGRVAGRVVVVNGDVHFRSGASIDGDLLVVGGRIFDADSGRVSGSTRTYSARMGYERRGERMVWRDVDRDEDPDEDPDDDRWWRRRDRWRNRSWGDLRLVTARTYNRVEGLPIQFGPVFGREFGWGRLSLDALGILRSTNSFAWTPPNLGHAAKLEVRLGTDRGVRFAARLFDVVEAVEPWHLGDVEAGLAAFFLHRDYRDFYNRHGSAVTAGLFQRRSLDLSATYSHVRWGARATTDPWTLFRDTDSWRANPQMDDARMHMVQGTLRVDTRNDDRDPDTGWFLTGEYEYGTGTIERYGPTTEGVRLPSPGGLTSYDRVFVDLRRYNRIAPGAQINFRVVAGGWLSGDELPLQRRFSLGGPGTLPGYDFRRIRPVSGVDRLQCSNYGVTLGASPAGYPGECERMAMAQVEFRGDLHLDPFGILDEDRDWRRRGWGRGAQWVVFADAGRGWLVGPEDGGRSFSKSKMPRLSTFQTDVGLGLVLDDLGLYIAKPLNDSKAPVNFLVRLRPRF